MKTLFFPLLVFAVGVSASAIPQNQHGRVAPGPLPVPVIRDEVDGSVPAHTSTDGDPDVTKPPPVPVPVPGMPPRTLTNAADLARDDGPHIPDPLVRRKVSAGEKAVAPGLARRSPEPFYVADAPEEKDTNAPKEEDADPELLYPDDLESANAKRSPRRRSVSETGKHDRVVIGKRGVPDLAPEADTPTRAHTGSDNAEDPDADGNHRLPRRFERPNRFRPRFNAAGFGQCKKQGFGKGGFRQGQGGFGRFGQGDGGDPQQSLTLDPRVICHGLAQDGQDDDDRKKGQVASLTSDNNFINFCLTQDVPLTDGKQIKDGSCNPTPMGRILSVDKMPSSKFVFPCNGARIAADESFTIRMAIKNLKTGNFVNPQTNYLSAPGQTTADGTGIGHSHVVIEELMARDQTTPTDPRKFAFFKGLNKEAEDGILSAEVTDGLPPGEYRMSSINSMANHQPCLVGVAQHGFLDDIVYFTAE